MRLFLLALVLFLACMLPAAEPFPSFDKFCSMIRKDHPRLFLNPDRLPEFRRHAHADLPEMLARFRKEAAALPEVPQINFKPGVGEIKNGRIIVHRHLDNQDSLMLMLKKESCWGRQSAQLAVLYLATGEKQYLAKASAYLKAYPGMLKLCRESRVMLEWWYTDRLAAITAWDMLYNDLEPKLRRDFLRAILEYSIYMQNPGYLTCRGCMYGERGLGWFLSVAAYGETDLPEGAGKLFRDCHTQYIEKLEELERLSAGTGMLGNICSGYCFGFFPFACCNFLHAVQNAAGMDGTRYFPLMKDYASFFSWMAIPSPAVRSGFCEFGWGDSFHRDNFLVTGFMYAHMAQVIHFFGKTEPERAQLARAVIERLPVYQRKFYCLSHYPYLPFLLTGFDPKVKNPLPPEHYLSKEPGAFFPGAGLTVMRSGTGPGDTYASFKAGPLLVNGTSHQHYDELSFILYKKGFLALDSGIRDGMPHHLAYYPQTVAHNSLLIRMPEERPFPYYWYPLNALKFDKSKLRCDGGQSSPKGKPLGFFQTRDYVITGGDATGCYSKLKCKEAMRQFVYIRPDYFVIYDRLESVKPEYEKVFLLHTQNRPDCLDAVWHAAAGEGALFLKTLLPQKSQVRVIGGPGREFWTNGKNYPVVPYWQKVADGPNWLGNYRLEIIPQEKAEQTRFLHVIQLADGVTKAMIPVKLVQDETHDGAELQLPDGRKAAVMFRRTGKPAAEVCFR